MPELEWDMKTSGFGQGTQIDTTEGPVPIEWLSTTHYVTTRDHGPQPVLAVEKHVLRPLDGAFVPLVTVMPDALMQGAPNHPLLLPPHHRMLLDGPEIAFHFGFDAALCHAGHMVDGRLIKRHNAGDATAFYTVLTPAHEVVQVNGIWAETWQADAGCALVGLDTLSPAIFTKLQLEGGGHVPAYPSLEDWEGRMLARLRGKGAKWAFADLHEPSTDALDDRSAEPIPFPAAMQAGHDGAGAMAPEPRDAAAYGGMAKGAADILPAASRRAGTEANFAPGARDMADSAVLTPQVADRGAQIAHVSGRKLGGGILPSDHGTTGYDSDGPPTDAKRQTHG